eukprot:SAG31_NODE_3378_length_4344_cov_7.620259_3_plen_164_part_00
MLTSIYSHQLSVWSFSGEAIDVVQQSNPEINDTIFNNWRDNLTNVYEVEEDGTLSRKFGTSEAPLFEGTKVCGFHRTDDLYWGRFRNRFSALAMAASRAAWTAPGIGYSDLLPVALLKLIREEPESDLATRFRRFVDKVRGYFLVFVQLFEKYGTLIERNTGL